MAEADKPLSEAGLPEPAGRLEGRIALITGASRGIGRAVAIRFAEEGADVILTARTSGGLEEVDDEIRERTGRNATLIPLDLCELDSIDPLGAALYERFGRIDALVANAGMLGGLTPLHHIDPDVWNQVMTLNATANWRLIRSLDPLLRASDAGRAVFTTAAAGHEPKAYWAAYAVSKAALEMMVRMYAEETRKSSIRVNLICPGPTRTAIRARAYPGEPPESLPSPKVVAPHFVELAAASCTRHGECLDLSARPSSNGKG